MNLDKHISELQLPFLDVILEEIFFLPPAGQFPAQRHPITIYDLAEICARPPELVWQKLQEIQNICPGIVLEDSAAYRRQVEAWRGRGKVPVLLDVRFEKYHRNDPVAGAFHLPTMTTQEWTLLLPNDGAAIVFSDDGRKSFSAAMWLREQARLDTFSIKTSDLRSRG